MAKFHKRYVIERLSSERIVPLFHHPDGEKAARAATAILSGGLSILEFTNRGDRALASFTEIAAQRDASDTELVLGAGSVIDPETAAQYVAAGADFIVGPAFVPSVARYANRRQIPYIPGTSTLTEMLAPSEAGCELLKFFPGGHGGPGFLKAILAPCPWLSVMPTGGVAPTASSLAEWYDAGATTVGIGSKLVSAAMVDAKDWAGIEQRVVSAIAARDEALKSLETA